MYYTTRTISNELKDALEFLGLEIVYPEKLPEICEDADRIIVPVKDTREELWLKSSFLCWKFRNLSLQPEEYIGFPVHVKNMVTFFKPLDESTLSLLKELHAHHVIELTLQSQNGSIDPDYDNRASYVPRTRHFTFACPTVVYTPQFEWEVMKGLREASSEFKIMPLW